MNLVVFEHAVVDSILLLVRIEVSSNSRPRRQPELFGLVS